MCDFARKRWQDFRVLILGGLKRFIVVTPGADEEPPPSLGHLTEGSVFLPTLMPVCVYTRLCCGRGGSFRTAERVELEPADFEVSLTPEVRLQSEPCCGGEVSRACRARSCLAFLRSSWCLSQWYHTEAFLKLCGLQIEGS